MAGYEYDIKPKKSNGSRFYCLGCLMFLLIIGTLAVSIAALVRQVNYENDDKSQGDSNSAAADKGVQQTTKSGQQNPIPTTRHSPTIHATTKVPTTKIDTRSDSVVECSVKNAHQKSVCENSEGCVWHERDQSEKTPACIHSNDVGYQVEGNISINNNKWSARLKRQGIQNVYGMVVYDYINIDVEILNGNALRIYMHPDQNANAWEIPDEALKMDIPETPHDKLYNVTFVTDRSAFGVVVERVINSTTKTKIFDTTLPGTIFSKQFMQVTTRLPSEHVYGFGEHNHRRFKHDMNWKTWPIFTRDVAPVDEWNLYGAHPVYLNLEEDGNANMVFLKNSHAMDVILQPDPHPAITYKVIGGVLDFYVFLGPSPKEAIQQYISAVGKPLMPPYWSLGFHLCKWGYENLTVVQDVVERNKKAEIFQDVQWGDIDYMFNKFDFTYDKKTFRGLPDYVNELHKNGQKYIVIVDPGIGANETIVAAARNNSPEYEMYHDGLNMDVFVKNSTGSVLVGEMLEVRMAPSRKIACQTTSSTAGVYPTRKSSAFKLLDRYPSLVWPGVTVFPDFTNINGSLEYWIKYIKYFYENEGVEFDGLWIDMNEPASFVQGSQNGCERNDLNYPPYVPHILDADKECLYYKTICMDSKQTWGDHYAVHSLYGHAESIVTYKALTSVWNKTRPFIMTRSSFSGTGKYSFKWLGDNQSIWSNMAWSIIGMMEFSMFGFPLIGADICGFWFAAQYEMCLRWSQLGAFYPFSRNHNAKGWPHQDPGSWDNEFISITRRALHIRYKILPYLYTQFHYAHTTGSLVLRPLVFEFPQDKETRDVDQQFLLGPAFLVSPVLNEGQSTVYGYFPKQRWYNYYDGSEFTKTGQYITVDAPLSIIPLHLRGGFILPTQHPANTTAYSRKRAMGLIVAFDEQTAAHGELFWDDGESIDSVEGGKYLKAEITASKGKHLEYKVKNNGYAAANSLLIDTIELYGVFSFPEQVFVSGKQIDKSQVRSKEKIIEIVGLKLNITIDFTVNWEFF